MAKLENKNTNNEELINDKPVIKKKRSLFLTILSTVSYSIIALVALILIIINLPVTKRYIANQAIDFLNKDLKMGMSIDDIDVNFFGDVAIKGLHIKDYKGNEFVKAKEMRVASDWMALAFNTRDIKFNQATVIEPTIRVITYKGDSISNFIRYVDNFDDGKPRDPKRKPFKMGMKFDIINGIASIINENSPGEAGKWLDARKVNLNVTSLKVEGADVSADIRNFNFITKRYGKEHIVDTFSTNFELTKKHLKLGNLTFNTDHSLLQGEVTMNLDPVTKFGDFGNKVKWDLKMIPGSQISGYDLSYFVPDWDNYTPINISGTMTGPLNDFTLNNFLIRSQEINLNTNKMTISSVLDKKFFIESKNVSADFTYKGLKASLPKFISSKMGNFADDFGRLKYNGSVRVNPKQVYATGNMITGIGQAKVTNFNLVDYSTKRPKYRGLAEVKDLNVTALTKNKQVGLISGKFNVQGEGFDVNTMYVKTTSDVNHIDLLGKSLNNISIDGILNKKRFTGNVNSNDAHAKGTFKGFVDFSTKRLLADFDADIKYVDLNYFGVSAGDTNSVSGHIVGKAAMTNLNDLNLDTSIQNLTLNSSSQKLHIPDSKIKAFFENGNRIVSLDAPGAVNGRISGRFDLEDIGKMITNSINKIMVGNPPKKTYNGQNFDFDFDVKQGLVAFFVPNLELPDGAKVAGKYDGNTNDLILNADATKIKYVMTSKKELTESEKFLAETDATYQPDLTKTKDSAMVDSLRLRVNTANFEKQLDLYAKRAQYAKNVLRDVDFVAANRNSQVLYISTTFELGTLDDEAAKKMKEYAVNINQTTNSAGDYVFRFEPTTITFNNVAWSVDTSPELNHSITYRNKEKDFIVQNLRIFSDESELLVKNADFKSAKDFTADAEVKNFDISKLLALGNGGENDLDIKGIANGTILVKKSGNNLEPLVDLDIENIFMNDKAMGNIETRITKSEKPNVFDVNIQALSSDLLGHNTLDVTGTIDNNPSSPVLDVSAKMDEFDLAFAQQFVKQIFGNFRGKATGDLKISGPMNDLDYSGDIALKGFGLKLLFTGVDYSFDDTVINLSRGLALLNNIAIKDGRSNSKGSISGSIQFETLSSLGVNLIMRADNLLVLNSTQEENDLFWGRVYGEGDVYVSGPVSGLEISTPNDGLKVINNSTFTFNSASTANVDEFKILRFLKRDEAGGISIEKKKQSGANMLIDFDVSIDKNSMVNVLVGDDVGSIAVKGDANHLKFRMERSGNILMNGTYTVDNGTFVSKAILDRTFQIARGSLIRWTGSPMLPDLDIKANYTRPITNTGEYLGMSLTQPVNIVLTTKITGTLTKPDIAFGVSAPDVSSQVRETLAEKMTNQDERVMQFGSILVLNSFNVASSGVPINVGNTALSQGVNMAFKQLGSVLNTISSNFQVNLDYITGDLGSNTSDRANTSVSLALSPRINFKTGLGVPIARTENTNSNYLSAEGTIEYDFSRANNGSRLLRAYSKPSNFGLGTATANALNQSYGVGVVYSRSFNSFRGLFRKRKNRDKTKSDTVAVRQNKEDSLKNKPIK